MSALATTNGMAKVEAANQIIAGMNVSDIGAVFAKSGLFQDVRDASQCVVKILAGKEAGIGPFAAMTGIHIIQGKPSMGYVLLGTCVKRSPRHDYQVRERSDKRAAIEFYRDGKSLGISEFTMAHAVAMGKAGGAQYKAQPATMLFARAMSQGVRTFCPEVTGGPMYTPDELGAPVGDDGELLHKTVANSAPEAAPRARAASLLDDEPAAPEAAQDAPPAEVEPPPCGFADVGDWYAAMRELGARKGVDIKGIDAAIKQRGYPTYLSVPEDKRREMWAALSKAK